MNAPDLAVRKEVVVARNVEDTFRIFTEELGEWWPLDSTYSVLQGEAVTAVMEPKEGGRIYELTADGRESDWGTVLEFDPPNGLTMQWHPGYGVETATTVVVKFEAIREDKTRLVLVHSGWEVHGPDAEPMAGGYATGWDFVLGCLLEHVGT